MQHSRAASSSSKSEILSCELFALKPERCEGGLGTKERRKPFFFSNPIFGHMNLIRLMRRGF